MSDTPRDTPRPPRLPSQGPAEVRRTLGALKGTTPNATRPLTDAAYDERLHNLASAQAVAQLHHRWASAISVAVQAISAIPGMPEADRSVILADLDGALGYHARLVDQAHATLARLTEPTAP